MARYEYNVVVIGAGSAGLVASYVAAAAKAKVALIERHRMGGDCLNTGCVPSKAIIRSASFMRDVRRARDLGFRSASAEFDFADIMERVQRVIRAIEPHDSVERYGRLGVDCISGNGEVISPHEVRVGDRTLTTRSIIIAAGARPFVPPIPGLDKVNYRTSDTIWDIREQPKRLVVLGGGPIGSELTQAFAYLGSQVTQIEGSERIMMREDREASEIVMRKFADAGVTIMTNTRATAAAVDDDGEQYLQVTDAAGEQRRVPFDLLLLAVGRAPNGDAVPGLKEAGVRVSERGVVEVDDKLQTSVPNIFACGDIIGSYQFTHTAGHAGVYAAINAMVPFGFLRRRVDWSVVPWCTFTHPEVARVGQSEQEARAQGADYEATVYGIDDLDRAIADEDAEGYVKLITDRAGKLLGVTIVGEHAGDLIHEYILAMKHKVSIKSLLATIHIYPTLAEANKFAAGEWNKAHLSAKAIGFSQWLNARLRG